MESSSRYNFPHSLSKEELIKVIKFKMNTFGSKELRLLFESFVGNLHERTREELVRIVQLLDEDEYSLKIKLLKGDLRL